MQGAALKLTALAASLAVGFAGLVQVQQGINQNPQETASTDLAENQIDAFLGDEEQTGFEEQQFAPLESVSSNPLAASFGFSNVSQESAESSRTTMPADNEFSANTQPAEPASFAPESDRQQVEPVAQAPGMNQFEAQPFTRTSMEAPQGTGTPPGSMPAGVQASIPAEPENDPFAVFVQQFNNEVSQEQAQASQQLKQTAEQAVTKLNGKAEELTGKLNQELDQWEGKIEQVSHETKQQVQNQFNQMAEQANPVMQAVANAVNENEPQKLITQVSDFAQAAPVLQPMKLELAQKFPQAGQTAAGTTSAKSPAPAAFPNAFPGAFPAVEQTPTTAAKASTPPTLQQQPTLTFPSAEPQSPEPQLTFPGATPAPAGMTAEVTPEVKETPEVTVPAQTEPAKTSAPRAFFDGFDNASEMPASSSASDSPYRLVPQFNPETPEPAGQAPASSNESPREPAPFQLSAEPKASESMTEKEKTPQIEPEQPKMSAPADSEPAVENNPFSAFPVPAAETQSTPAAEKPVMKLSPAVEAPKSNPFSGFPAPDSEPVSEEKPESKPAADNPPLFMNFPAENSSAPEAKPSEKTTAPESSAPESPTPNIEIAPQQPVEENQPAQPESPAMSPNPFGAVESKEPAGFPTIEPANSQPAEKPVVESKPAEAKPVSQPEPMKAKTSASAAEKSQSESAEPLREDELLGAAQVDDKLMESIQQPKIELYKSAPESAVLGQPMIYSIEVVNSGQVAVRDVVVEDQFPAGTKLTGTIPRAELVEKTLVWKFAELKPAERKKILVRVVSIEPGTVGSISTVSYKSVVAAQTLVTAPKLELKVVASEQEIAVGESIALTFVISNSGQGEARDVILRNVLPAGMEHPAGADLEYEIGLLKGGESKEVPLSVVAKEAGDFSNYATIRSSGGFSVEQETPLRIIPSVLTLTQNGPTRRFVGHAATYEYSLKNNTQRVINEATVSVKVPEGLEFQTASESGSFNPVTRTVNWKLAQLEPSQESKLSLAVLPRSVGTRELNAVAKTANHHQADVTSQIRVEGFASLAVRVPDERGPVVKGERVSLRFRVVNRGSASASQVLVNCKVPEQLEYLSANGPVKGELVDGMVRFAPISTLSPNQELTFDLVFNAQKSGDARVEFEAAADQITTPIKHQEQVLVYGD